MIIDINKQQLTVLYNKTKKMYAECIQHKDNGFLKDEIQVPFDQIQLKNLSVKVVFDEETAETYSRDISIALWHGSVMIGKYSYIEDEQGQVLDDSLVFF